MLDRHGLAASRQHPRGAAVQWVALGDGVIDLKTLSTRFRQLCPNAPFLLEIITGRPPQIIPYLEPAFWTTDPATPAVSLAQFEKIVKNGHPFMGTMLIPVPNAPKSFLDAFRDQERVDLERSFTYARQHLAL